MPLGLLMLHVEQIFVPRFKRSLTDRLGIIDLEGECIEEANSASESSKTRAVNAGIPVNISSVNDFASFVTYTELLTTIPTTQVVLQGVLMNKRISVCRKGRKYF